MSKAGFLPSALYQGRTRHSFKGKQSACSRSVPGVCMSSQSLARSSRVKVRETQNPKYAVGKIRFTVVREEKGTRAVIFTTGLLTQKYVAHDCKPTFARPCK